MECRGQVLCYPKLCCEGPAKVRCEAWISVRDKFLREPEPSVNVVEVQLCDLGTGNFLGAWEEDCSVGASMIDDGEDGVVVVRLGQTYDEVHSHLLEG